MAVVLENGAALSTHVHVWMFARVGKRCKDLVSKFLSVLLKRRLDRPKPNPPVLFPSHIVNYLCFGPEAISLYDNVSV